MAKATVEVEIDIDDHELEERIVYACAEIYLRQTHVSDQHAHTQKVIHAAIERRAEAIVTDLFTKGVRPVDAFGEPKGDMKPVSEIFMESLTDYLAQPVRENGEPVKRGGDGWSGTAKMTRGEWLIRKVATDKLTALAHAEVKRVNEQARTTVRETVAKAIADQMQKL